MSIEILDTHVIYKNPKPHVRSVHAYFPSVADLGGGELLASVALAEAFEAANMRTHICRSTDGGTTWELEGEVPIDNGGRLKSNAARIARMPDGRIVLFMVRHDRTEHPGDGLANPETLGFVPTELLLLESTDDGHTWNPPRPIEPPLEGPCFELCSPITRLEDGRWILPTQTWQDWDGRCPNGIRMVAFVSHDEGQTWPEYWDVMHEDASRVYYWESKIIEVDGALLATAWVYDEAAGSDRPNHYALSRTGGETWTPPASTGLQGQTLTPLALGGGRILCVYRRMDKPGLWAQLAHIEDGRWVNGESKPLWGAQSTGLTGASDNMASNFAVLRFGAPCLTRLNADTVHLAFWCYEECTGIIRGYNLRICE